MLINLTKIHIIGKSYRLYRPQTFINTGELRYLNYNQAKKMDFLSGYTPNSRKRL